MLAHGPNDVSCKQTQIYEAEFETEHNDHKHTLQENRRLKKKREEMRQQVALLQEQVAFLLSLCMHSHKDKHKYWCVLTNKNVRNAGIILLIMSN